MARRKVDLRSVFEPTDSITLLVIIIGLFIALFLDQMAVRLIGVCIAVLGGVALFMMLSPRLTEVSMQRPPRPTESPLFTSKTTSDGNQTRQVFDSQAYRETFGAVESGGEGPLDELQIGLFEDDPQDKPKQQFTAGVPLTPVLGPIDLEPTEGQSTVRVVGVKPRKGKTTVPKLAIDRRGVRSENVSNEKSQENKPEPAFAPTTNPDQVITGVISDVVQISDDVVVRPKDIPSTPQPSVPIAPSNKEDMPERIPVARVVTEDAIGQTTDIPLRNEIRISSFMADDDEEMEASEEPRKEFDYLLNRVLMVIRSATSARTTAFFWFNKDRQQLVLEARITDAAEQFTDQRKIPIGGDVVSQIALEGRPEIITHITPSAELELLPYYTANAATLSFVGVPVYFRGSVVGVLCADTIEQNAYTDITVGFFGHFTKLIGGLVLSYTSKYDLQQNARTLEIVQQFRLAVADSDPTIDHVIDSLFGTVIKYMDISTIGVCAFDPALRMWTIRSAKSVVPEYEQLIGAPVDLENSVVGECLTNGETIAVSVESSSIRVTPSEPEIDLCQLVALPMRSLLLTHGALFIENHKGTITNQDVAIAEMLSDLAGEMIAGLREGSRDVHTGDPATEMAQLPVNETVLFADKLREEVARSADYGVPLTLCLIKADDLVGMGTEDKGAVLLSIMDKILQRIHEYVREYDIVDHIAADTLAVALVAYNAHEAQFWTESLRKDVANTSVELNNKQWSTTISVGVAQLESGDTWEVLQENTQRALDASIKIKNKVTVYS